MGKEEGAQKRKIRHEKDSEPEKIFCGHLFLCKKMEGGGESHGFLT